jgi:hypothetical protein
VQKNNVDKKDSGLWPGNVDQRRHCLDFVFGTHMDMDMDIGSADMGIVEVKVEFGSTVDVAVVAVVVRQVE